MFKTMYFSLLFSLIMLLTSALFAQMEEDPYLWLEEVDGEKALEWVKSQNQRTLDVLQKDPAFNPLNEKILQIYNSKERIAYPSMRGKFLYNFWQDQNHVRGIWRRTTLEEYRKPDPKWETVLDMDELCKQENEKWVYKGANFLYPDYQRCLVNLSRGGGDAVEIREFDLLSKKFVKEGFFLPEAKSRVSWKDLNTLYVGTNFGEGSLTTSGYPRISKLWRRGTPLSEAQTVFEGEPTDMSAGVYVIHTPERSYTLMIKAITYLKVHYYALEDDQKVKLDIPEDAEFSGILKNQLLIQLKTDWTVAGTTYPQGGLYAIDYDRFLNGERNFTTLVQPDERSSISSVSTTQNHLLIGILNNVRGELFRYAFRNGKWSGEKVNTPDFGMIGVVSTDDFTDQYFLTHTGFLNPTTLFFASADGKMEKLKSLPAFYDSEKYQVEQFETPSRDSTPIPYFVVRAKNMANNSANPTLLYGYGGFEIPMTPSYLGTTGIAWLEKGGVYVLANIRGGGEFGPRWHLAALKEKRQNAYDDFIAVAEDLVARKITSPKHLGIMGGSNGGLLVGVLLIQRPDLFNAVVCQVPLLDMKRYNKLLAGASWMAEYGNPDIPEEWAFIQKYSPYQNLKKGAKYPLPLFTTTTRDDRVHPGHARKMVAKMAGMGYPVYYYENIEGGHGSGSTNEQRAFMTTVEYIYLWQQLR